MEVPSWKRGGHLGIDLLHSSNKDGGQATEKNISGLLYLIVNIIWKSNGIITVGCKLYELR